MWCVVVCDHENLMDEEAIARTGLQSQKKTCVVACVLNGVLSYLLCRIIWLVYTDKFVRRQKDTALV
jgi:hypothetical protein